MLLAKVPAGRLEPALLPLERLGLAANGGGSGLAAIFGNARLGRLGHFCSHQDLGPVRHQGQRSRAEPQGGIGHFCRPGLVESAE